MWVDLACSFFISSGMAVLNNVQRKYTFLCGISGIVTMLFYEILEKPLGMSAASLVACIALSIFAHIISYKVEIPSMIFVVSGVMPILPGRLLFNAINALVKNNYSQAGQFGGEAALVGFAIGIGFLIDQVITIVVEKVSRKYLHKNTNDIQ